MLQFDFFFFFFWVGTRAGTSGIRAADDGLELLLFGGNEISWNSREGGRPEEV